MPNLAKQEAAVEFFKDSMCVPVIGQHEWRWDYAAFAFKRQCECGLAWRDDDDAEWHGPSELN